MYDRDIGNLVKEAVGISPQDASAGTVDGPAIDRRNYESIVGLVTTGAVTGAPSAQSVTAQLQDSADGSTDWQDVGDSVEITAADSAAKLKHNLHKARAYVRVQLNVSFTGGSTPSIQVAAGVGLGFAKELPPA